MPKNTRKCQGFESFQRLNYLFQIRDFMAINVGNIALSTYYGSLIDSIAKKSVLRIDPVLKKQSCKKCKGALLPGTTADVKIKNGSEKSFP
ncbi:ribonuclease P protein subunit Rpp21 isoform X2 [Arctopsyche grandis]|uniref:ribonuclease P protein subunit Rpp21 isoform X2 n=1 Tax=Arctopsyche grandis TaxID=121162 RepID=UPI00406D89AE